MGKPLDVLHRQGRPHFVLDKNVRPSTHADDVAAKLKELGIPKRQ